MKVFRDLWEQELPFNENKFNKSNKKGTIKSENNKLSEIQRSIVSLMSDSPTITQAILANLLDVNIRTIQRNIKELMDLGIIERIGATKKGEWKINKRKITICTGDLKGI